MERTWILGVMMQNHHPNSDFIPDINTLLCYLSYHYVTHVTQNILSNASGFVLLDIYPKSVIEDMCQDLKTNEVYY